MTPRVSSFPVALSAANDQAERAALTAERDARYALWLLEALRARPGQWVEEADLLAALWPLGMSPPDARTVLCRAARQARAMLAANADVEWREAAGGGGVLARLVAVPVPATPERSLCTGAKYLRVAKCPCCDAEFIPAGGGIR